MVLKTRPSHQMRGDVVEVPHHRMVVVVWRIAAVVAGAGVVRWSARVDSRVFGTAATTTAAQLVDGAQFGPLYFLHLLSEVGNATLVA